jgi:hypothetical protein
MGVFLLVQSIFASGAYNTTKVAVAFPLREATLRDFALYRLEAKML